MAGGSLHSYCMDETFVCDGGETPSAEAEKFNTCLKAVDCAMEYDMRVTAHSTSVTTTFMHQMIPHHVNAVNMAKLLMKDGSASGDDEVMYLLQAIVNTQNAQIHFMRDWLDGESVVEGSARCPRVEIDGAAGKVAA